MKALLKRMVDELGVAETSAVQYLQTLYRLNDNKPFRNMGWSKDTATVEENVKDLAEGTRAVYYRSLASVLSLYKTYKKWVKYWKTKGETLQPRVDKTKTEKQSDNWLEWKDVEKVRDALEQRSSLLKNEGRGRTLDEEEFSNLLDYLVVSLYTLVQPRRNKDYSLMYVVKNWRPSMSEEFNYYDIKTKRFIFNNYKTAKTYGQQIEEVPEELQKVLNLYIKYHPLRKQASYPLIVNYLGEELNPVNGITRLLNRVFGKNLGSSMLRHIYLTNKYGGAMIDEKEEDARKMAHSVKCQQEIYVKK